MRPSFYIATILHARLSTDYFFTIHQLGLQKKKMYTRQYARHVLPTHKSKIYSHNECATEKK